MRRKCTIDLLQKFQQQLNSGIAEQCMEQQFFASNNQSSVFNKQSTLVIK